MTEKDYRRLITDLELSKEDKELFANITNTLYSKLSSSIRHFKVKELLKGGSYASGTLYHGTKHFDLFLVLETSQNTNFSLANQAALNEIWNIIYFSYPISKMNQLVVNLTTNTICAYIDDFYVNIILRFDQPLQLQSDFYIDQDYARLNFVSMAQSEFKLYKNTLQLIKYARDEQSINVPGYIIDLLLYYGLSENFTVHTYEAYLKEFVHAIEDFLKGIKIEQDDETYRNMKQTRVQLQKKPYMIIDIANPSNNLTANIQDGALNEYRKLKKAILKLMDN